VVTSDTIWSPAKAAEFVRAMEAAEIDIVIGTQLVTKGYHFPNLTLVGVVDAISACRVATCGRPSALSSRCARFPAGRAGARSRAAC
jgi:hypothetical protein